MVGAGSPRGSEQTHIMAAFHLGIMNEGVEPHQCQGCAPQTPGQDRLGREWKNMQRALAWRNTLFQPRPQPHS